jgi:hypothetical protein
MVLPASQYSVLDAKRIERLDEDTFRCHVGGLKLFSLEVEPVLTVSVTVQERGPTVRLLSTKVKCSAFCNKEHAHVVIWHWLRRTTVAAVPLRPNHCLLLLSRCS